MVIKNIKKDYGTTSSIVMYRREFKAEPPRCIPHYAINCQICYKRGKRKNLEELSEDERHKFFSSRKTSTRRSKTTITDYALSNKFSQFITLTFDQKLTNSFDYDHCKKLVSKWINNQRRHSPHLSYILVSEKHKSGAIHFHMVTNNYHGNLTIARNSKTNRKIIKNGKQIYNIDGWKYGFSTLSNITDEIATAYYLQKYLTKDFIEAFNKKRYWCSRGLKKPTVQYNVDEIEEINNNLPLFTTVFKSEMYYKYTFTPGSVPTRTPEQIRNFTRRKIRDMVSSH